MQGISLIRPAGILPLALLLAASLASCGNDRRRGGPENEPDGKLDAGQFARPNPPAEDLGPPDPDACWVCNPARWHPLLPDGAAGRMEDHLYGGPCPGPRVDQDGGRYCPCQFILPGQDWYGLQPCSAVRACSWRPEVAGDWVESLPPRDCLYVLPGQIP